MLVITRAVNVDAFRPCSAQTVKYASSARALAGSGCSPVIACSSRAAAPRCADSAEFTGCLLSRSRAKAPTAAGPIAISSRAWSAVGGQSMRRSAPNAENAVRSASSGAHEVGSPRSAASTVGDSSAGGSTSSRSGHSPSSSNPTTRS